MKKHGLDAKLKNNFIDKNNKPNFISNFGYIILKMALGGYQFDAFNSSETLKLIQNKREKFCCYLHLLLDSEKNLKHKNTIKNYLKINNFSESFIDFMCKSLSFNYKHNLADLLATPFMKQFHLIKSESSKVSLKEVIKITKESKKSSRINQNTDKKILNFLNNFEIILSNNKELRKQDIYNLIKSKPKTIKELSYDLGTMSNNLSIKLENITLSC